VRFKQLLNFSFDILPKSMKGRGRGHKGGSETLTSPLVGGRTSQDVATCGWKDKMVGDRSKRRRRTPRQAGGGKQTSYGIFAQAWRAHHKRQYPDELIHKEIEEFNQQCLVWWYDLLEQERKRLQEMEDQCNTTTATLPLADGGIS
jgi:hypothetical protein